MKRSELEGDSIYKESLELQHLQVQLGLCVVAKRNADIKNTAAGDRPHHQAGLRLGKGVSIFEKTHTLCFGA